MILHLHSTASSNLTSSSIYGNDYAHFGPQYAIAGPFPIFGRHFKTKKEDFPWIQWKLPAQVNITGIKLSSQDCSRLTSDCPVLRNIEVRAGRSSINDGVFGKITNNNVCGNFKGPGMEAGEYTIKCKNTLLADVISIQLLDDDSILQLRGIQIEKDVNGKYY